MCGYLQFRDTAAAVADPFAKCLALLGETAKEETWILDLEARSQPDFIRLLGLAIHGDYSLYIHLDIGTFQRPHGSRVRSTFVVQGGGFELLTPPLLALCPLLPPLI